MEPKHNHLLLRTIRVIVAFAYIVLLAYVVILSIAFVLQLLGANPDADFARWIYRSADRIMEPFRGLFPPKEFDGNSVFDGSMLFAIFIYSMLGALLGYGADRLSDRLQRVEAGEGAGTAPPQAAWPPPPPTVTDGVTAASVTPTQWAPGPAAGTSGASGTSASDR